MGPNVSHDAEIFHSRLLEAIPKLRAAARGLSRDPCRSDDLVQEVLLKAWERQDTLEEIDSLVPWLLTILRNLYRSSFRRRRFEVEAPDADIEASLSCSATQDLTCQVLETLEALDELATEVREALILTTIDGLSYEDAAAACDCAVGTIKSRVNRARRQLKEILGQEPKQFLELPVELTRIVEVASRTRAQQALQPI